MDFKEVICVHTNFRMESFRILRKMLRKDELLDELQDDVKRLTAERDKYGKALDEMRKAYRMWWTGEIGKLELCSAVKQIFKDAGK